jgi:hypothetical protein
MDRKQLGQQRLGEPVAAAFDALVDAVDRQPWADFRREPVGYYFSKMLGGWFLRLADGALSDRQLAGVGRADVLATSLLLLRDMFRHNARLLRPATADAGWVEPLFAEAAAAVGLPASRLADDGQLYELDDMSACGWARPLAAPFGFPAEKLFAAHSAIVTGARDEFAT